MLLNALSRFLLVVLLALSVSEFGRADVSAADENNQPLVVFLTADDPHNYEAHRTIPRFAESLESDGIFRTAVLMGEGDPAAFRFPGLEVIEEADLLVIFFRRRALSEDQLALIREYLEQGKPLVGIRTAHHAFAMRREVAEGYEAWDTFAADVLGCRNRGYGPTEPGTQVTVAEQAADHPILPGVDRETWHSTGNVYHVSPLLDEEAEVLLKGTVGDAVEPIAWTRRAGTSRVFYTSLGHPADFEDSQFRTLLVNGMRWATEHDEPE